MRIQPWYSLVGHSVVHCGPEPIVMTEPGARILADIEAVNQIPVVPVMLDVICRITGMGFAAVGRVTSSQWIACSVLDKISFGLKPGGELQLETTICDEIRQCGEGVIIDHVQEDAQYRHHHTPAMYGFQSYISLPIFLKNGEFFGTLCAIDPRPARLNNPETIGMFRLFADLIAFHLDANEQHGRTRQQLSDEQKIAELREQFIAILGHDLRNPVGAIRNSAALLAPLTTNADMRSLVAIIQNASHRMENLIGNILDFAMGRLGGGITSEMVVSNDLEEVIEEVIREMELLWPRRVINREVALHIPVRCDEKRVAQLFSNLLGNALSYGDPLQPVTITMKSKGNFFLLSVCNEGTPIPEEIQAGLFRPFSRGQVKPGNKGLGLGLYIASEIARSHGGILKVESSEAATCFTFEMTL